MDYEFIKECIDYDPGTGVFRWRARPPNHYRSKHGWKVFNSRCAGKVCGGSISDGYLQIKISGRPYLAHRLAWLLINGEWPSEEIDHINHDRLDNRIENLREVSRRENQMNRSMQKNNTSGVNGVRLHKASGKWLAYIRVDGKEKSLGYFSRFSEAVSARKSGEEKYGFHQNHGSFAC